jgi:hypothetical protein
MDDLVQFFRERDERLEREKAKAEHEQNELGERRQRELQDEKLLRQDGAGEYEALKQEVRSLAELYSTKGFTCHGERVRLGGVEVSFRPADTVDGTLQNPGVVISPAGLGAVRRDLQQIDLTLVPINGKLGWSPSRPPKVGEQKSTAEVARLIIRRLTEAADSLAPF